MATFQPTFPVLFYMNFTDRMRVYKLTGSAVFPDAESLMIPLMRQQFICMPMRVHQSEDWTVISYQDLTNMYLPWMPTMRFVLIAENFFLATF